MLADDDDEKVKRMLKSKHLRLMFAAVSCHLCLMYIKLNIYTHEVLYSFSTLPFVSKWSLYNEHTFVF